MYTFLSHFMLPSLIYLSADNVLGFFEPCVQTEMVFIFECNFKFFVMDIDMVLYRKLHHTAVKFHLLIMLRP